MMFACRYRSQLYLLPLGIAIAGLCCDSTQPSALVPSGPPEVLQVVMAEWVADATQPGSNGQNRRQLAFGDHPGVSMESDDRQVTNALPHRQRVRIVVDELLVGNNLEELACADGITYSRIPPGTTPDDIAKCSGPVDLLGDCVGDHAVCPSLGILDQRPMDGVADAFRLISSVAQIMCGGMNIPLNLEQSFYQPSGNQQLSAVGIDSLGPAIVLVPGEDGLPTLSECGVRFSNEVVDKDGETLCARSDGSCTAENINFIRFTVDQLRVNRTDPGDGAAGVATKPEMGDDTLITIEFNAVIDELTISAIKLFQSAGMVEVPVTLRLAQRDAGIVELIVPGGYAANTSYQVEIGSGDTGVGDRYGGALPESVFFEFVTGP